MKTDYRSQQAFVFNHMNQLSKFLQRPGENVFTSSNQILGFLKETKLLEKACDKENSWNVSTGTLV